MNRLSIILILISLFKIIHSTYNPIPIGAVIITTMQYIYVMQPKEYGGTDELIIIYSADTNMTIVNTIYDPTPRNLYILFTKSNSSALYLCQLDAVELLDTTIYQLPVTFDIANINQLTSFTSDIINRRVFLTDKSGAVTLFSMSGLLETSITATSNQSSPIRSVAYTNVLNRLFMISDSSVYSCINLDTNNLQCCQASPQASKLRSIAFDQILADVYVYVMDENSGIYKVILDTAGCPTALRPINAFQNYRNLQFVIDRGLYFASGSPLNSQDNSLLLIANQTQDPRSIPIKAAIVALHISYPNTQTTSYSTNECFRGITYSTYRAAVILAAVFGTIMGIFMCFNALFCIDFFMTKRIIRSLKQQIPHNLLEDRWNKLVEEKYAKIALEKQRKQNDPPPARRKSSIGGRKTSAAATASSNNDNNQANTNSINTNDSLQVPKPISNISAYLRRKSESYLSRRRSDDYRTQRQQEFTDPQRNPVTTAQLHNQPLHEENESQHGLRQNLSRRELLKNDEDFL